jgi:hypothetical protein
MYEGCTEKVVAGYEEVLDAGDHDNPYATMPGLRAAWCKKHEQQALKTPPK